MKKVLSFIIPVFFLAAPVFAVPNINSITDNSPVGMYEKFEATYSLGNTYSNPYDPAVIDVNVDFTSPAGKHYNVNGFIYQAFTRSGDFSGQSLTPSGPLAWKARFAPDETGTWSYQISAYDGVTDTASIRTFTVNSSSKKGFAGVSSKDSRYFAYSNGENYFPLGEGMGWAGNGRTYQYDAWVASLAAAGGNYIRVWTAPWADEVEWAWTYPASPALPGNYGARQGEAWELDHLFDLADSNNIMVLLTLINHGKFSSTTNPNWDTNPYNSNVNPSGLISTPQEVWTNAAVQVYLKRVWRYYISRYAYATSLFSWELWNEMEWTDDYSNQVAGSAAWHQASRDYFKLIDPYKHMVVTSYAHAMGWPTSVWNAGMDFTQEHNYGGTDMAAYIHSTAGQMMLRCPGKPFMQEEMGISTTSSGSGLDPTGISIHESNWASVMSGCGGGALPWWWDEWIHPSNLYYRWTGTANFLRNEALDSYGYVPVSPAVSTSLLSDYLVSPGFTQWATAAPQNDFTASTAGYLAPPETNLGDRLYGSWYASAKNPPTFHVNYPAAGKFRVYDVEEYSTSNGSANALRIDLDGVPALDQNPTYMGTAYEINVPAGPHTIYVTNTGNDWIIVSYAFTNYTGLLRCYALSGAGKILGWVQSRNYTYWQQHNNVTLTAAADGVVNLRSVSDDGVWRVFWWDTLNGVQSGPSADYNATGGNLDIDVPLVTKDAAFKAYYVGTPLTPYNTPTTTPTFAGSPTLTPSPTVTTTATPLLDNSLYPFEDGTLMGWSAAGSGASNPQNSTARSFLGSRSISVDVDFSSANSGELGTMAPLITDVRGRTIIARVWVPLDYPPYGGAQVFIKSGTGWVWQNGVWLTVIAGAWNTVYFDIDHPSYTGAGTPNQQNIRELGVNFAAPGGYSGTWSGTCYIDSVNITTPVPTSTATATRTCTPIAGPAPPVSNLDNAHVYPSLLKVSGGERALTFVNLTQKCMIKVYNMGGELVMSSNAGSVSGVFQWEPGAGIAPGLYIYFIRDEEGHTAKGKFAVVR